MIIQELIPPYRQARVAILLDALGIPWLKDRVPLTSERQKLRTRRRRDRGITWKQST